MLKENPRKKKGGDVCMCVGYPEQTKTEMNKTECAFYIQNWINAEINEQSAHNLKFRFFILSLFFPNFAF